MIDNAIKGKVYDDNNVEIGLKDDRGVHYYDTPEARAYFTKMTGHKFRLYER